jgi:hypothetical protein
LDMTAKDKDFVDSARHDLEYLKNSLRYTLPRVK